MDPTGCLRLLCPRPHQVRELIPLTVGVGTLHGNIPILSAIGSAWLYRYVWLGFPVLSWSPRGALLPTCQACSRRSALVIFHSHIGRFSPHPCA